MSQFNEEARHSDPSQGTITKFIVQKGSSRQNLDDNDSFDLDASKNCLGNDEMLSLSYASHETSYDQLKDVVEYEEQSVTPNQECKKKEDRTQVLEGDALLRKHKDCKADSNAEKTEAVSVFPQMEPLVWVDGYRCNLCGIELPPSFVEERQEHSDFHLAQRLQNEESGPSSSTTPTSKRRSVHSNNLLSLLHYFFLTSLCFSLKLHNLLGFSERKRQIPSQRSRNQIKRMVANTFQYTHSSQRAIKTREPCS